MLKYSGKLGIGEFVMTNKTVTLNVFQGLAPLDSARGDIPLSEDAETSSA